MSSKNKREEDEARQRNGHENSPLLSSRKLDATQDKPEMLDRLEHQRQPSYIALPIVVPPEEPASKSNPRNYKESHVPFAYEVGPSQATVPLIPEVLATMAVKHPDRPAIERKNGVAVTYGELGCQVEDVASLLVSQGVGPETVVAVASEPSYEAIVTELAVLRAGGAFLPLDLSYPVDRLEFMIKDSRARLTVGCEAIGQQVIGKERQLAFSALHEARPKTLCRVDRLRGEQLAYIVYTSGSTGTPKGVMITQRSLAQLAASAAEVLKIGLESRMLQFSSLSFDMSVGEVYGTLAAGGTIVLLAAEDRVVGGEFSALVARRRITHSLSTPSVWKTVPMSDLPHLEVIMIGGEVVSLDLAARWARPGRRVMNAYGPTETTFIATQGDWHQGMTTLPIGRPIPGYHTLIVDERLRRVRLGETGELCIGGVGVGRGYLGRPDLTAERFVPDLSGPPGARMYRTNDQARFNERGEIEFRGRLDSMVKIRGYRVELGDVEAALLGIEGVKGCAVIDEADDEGRTRLVGYLVDGMPSVGIIRDELERRLPRYMHPERLRRVSAIPLNINGKVDRSALRDLSSSMDCGDAVDRGLNLRRLDTDTQETALQRGMLSIWSRLLERSVRLDDDFFELGGHSLLALRLQDQVRSELKLDLRLADLFKYPTPQALVSALLEATHEQKAVVSLNESGAGGPFFCIHPSGGDVLCYAALARALGPDQPFYALQDPCLVGHEPAGTLIEMASAYLRIIRTIQPTGPLKLGGWSMGGIVALEMARQQAAEGEAVAAVVAIDSMPPERIQWTAIEEEEGANLLAVVRRLESIQGRTLLEVSGPEFLSGKRAEQLALVTRIAHVTGLLPESAGPEALSTRLELLRHHETLLREHSFTPFEVPLTLLVAQNEDRPHPLDALGWKDYVLGPIKSVLVSGDHLTVMSPQHAATLARAVAQGLNEFSGGESSDRDEVKTKL